MGNFKISKWNVGGWLLVSVLLLPATCMACQELTEEKVSKLDRFWNSDPSVNDTGKDRLFGYKGWIYHQSASGEPYKKLVPGICPQWIPKRKGQNAQDRFYMFLPVGYDGKHELWMSDLKGDLLGKSAEGYFHVNTTPVLSPDGKVLVSVFRPLATIQRDNYYISVIEINESVSEPCFQQRVYHSKGAPIIDLKFVDSETISFNLEDYDQKLGKNIKKRHKVKFHRNLTSSFNNQKDYFIEKCFLVSWDYAKEILLKGGCEGGKQYHSGWVTFKMERDGRLYLTKPPKMDYIFEFLKKNNLSDTGFATE